MKRALERALPGRVLALTPGDVVPGGERELLRRADEACGAGLRAILLREPKLGDRATLELARTLRTLVGASAEGGWLGLHDRVHLAEAAGADAVHLGFRSLAPRAARTLLPEHVAIGFSAHAGDALEVWEASDYLLLGPVFETPTKRGLREALGRAGLERELARAPRPVWAVGGIDPNNAAEILASGVAGIAVVRAVLGAALDSLARRAAVRALLEAARATHPCG